MLHVHLKLYIVGLGAGRVVVAYLCYAGYWFAIFILWIICISCTNTDITFQWFQEVFEPRTRPMNGINQHCILVLDGHSTHVENYEFIKYAIDHNIHLLCLPSHSTHVLLPLNVGIFSPLTTYYKQELEDHVHQQGPYGRIKKGDIFPMLQRARQKTFQPETIRSA